jgi:hypothetical protein
MAMFMRENGWMIKLQVKVSTNTTTVQNIKVSGLMTISMAREYRVGWMAVNTKDSISKEKRTVKANIPGKMAVTM